MKKTLLVLWATAVLAFGQGQRPPVDKLSLMRDVDLTGLTTGQILGWNGTKWHPITADKTLVGLSNVDNTSDATKNSASATLSSKTISVSQANVFGFIDYIQFNFPHQGDGTNATRIFTEGPTYGHFVFPDGKAKASNYVYYRCKVPRNFDNTKDLKATFTFRLNCDDTGSHAYFISMANVPPTYTADGDGPPFINEVSLHFAGDSVGLDRTIEQVGAVTLVGWASALTPDNVLVIRLARGSDGGGGATDTSTCSSNDVNLTISYQTHGTDSQ